MAFASDPEKRQAGLAKMAEVYGWEVSDGEGDFFGYTVEHLFGDIWQRPGLSQRDRRLLLIGMLVGANHHDVTPIQLGAALGNGELDEEALREIVVLVAHYGGWPAGARLFGQVEKVIADAARAEGGSLMAEPVLQVHQQGAVRTLVLDRPAARNAFDVALYTGLARELDRARDDDAVHVVVLTGAGTVFSAGQDLAEMAALATGTAPEGAEHGFRTLLAAVEAFDKPLLAAVNGPGVGIGFTLLLHCDLVWMAASARLRVPFAEMGVPPEAASSLLLAARMGRQQAARVLLTADWVSAADAVAHGIALDVVPDDELQARVAAVAARIAEHPLAGLARRGRAGAGRGGRGHHRRPGPRGGRLRRPPRRLHQPPRLTPGAATSSV